MALSDQSAGNEHAVHAALEGPEHVDVVQLARAGQPDDLHFRRVAAREARRAVLEFYLLNHPLDCPICDRGGECPLQDYTLKYGPGESRSVEEKVHRTKHQILGPHVVFDAERCILCTRWVRFCHEIPKTGELGVFSRGDRSEINLFPGKVLDNAYSGNVIDLCPVGALTSREYRFQSRPWDLVRHTESICPLCSNGCNVTLDVRHRQKGEELLRIRPRENRAGSIGLLSNWFH